MAFFMQRIVLILVLLSGACSSNAQSIIKGICKDAFTDLPVAKFIIHNLNTKEKVATDATGAWSITVNKNDLIYCTHITYDTIRLRIKNDKLPSYYYLEVKKASTKLPAFVKTEKAQSFAADSAQTYETYKVVLEKPGEDDLDASVAPMANMSKKFREEQKFKAQLKGWQQQKFIDQKFSVKRVGRITGLTGDTLTNFMKMYRPSYDLLRSYSDYEFLAYIKLCLYEFCPVCYEEQKKKKLSSKK